MHILRSCFPALLLAFSCSTPETDSTITEGSVVLSAGEQRRITAGTDGMSVNVRNVGPAPLRLGTDDWGPDVEALDLPPGASWTHDTPGTVVLSLDNRGKEPATVVLTLLDANLVPGAPSGLPAPTVLPDG